MLFSTLLFQYIPIQETLEFTIKFIISLNAVIRYAEPMGCLTTPNVAPNRLPAGCTLNRTGGYMSLLRIQIVLEKDVAATLTTTYAISNADLGVAYRGLVNEWLLSECPLQ